MRFLHAADLHLDSPLQSLALRNPVLRERLSRASREALRRLVDVAIEESVDALVLAGDLFDSGVPDLTARAALVGELARLERAGIDTAIIWGNHDATLAADRYGPLGDRIHILTRNRPTFRIEGAAIHGIGFAQRHIEKSLLPNYPTREPGIVNIGLMHTSLDGAEGHDRYAPCGVSDLLSHGYDYWALGHIHKRAEYRGEGSLAVMGGIPQGRHVNEADGGTATLVTVDANGVHAEERAIASLIFERLAVPFDAEATQTARQDAIGRAVASRIRPGREVALRVVLEGQGVTPLMAEAGAGRAFVEEAFSGIDGVHLDKVELRAGDTPLASADIAELAALMREEAAKEGFRDEIAAMLADWQKAMPSEMRDVLSAEAFDDLAEEGMAAVIARLAGSGESA